MHDIAAIHGMLFCAIASGTELKIACDFKKPATAGDLASIEKAVDRLVSGILRKDFGFKPKEVPKMYLDLQKGTYVDDGDNTVTLTLDFGKIVPGERSPELLAEVEKLRTRLGLSGDFPAGVEV